MLCERSMKSVATGRGQNSKRPRSGHIETSPEHTNPGRLEYEGYQRVDRGYMYASTKYEVSRWSVASCKNQGSFTSKFVLDPNPSLMAKCIQTTNEIPTAWAAFRHGAGRVPKCSSAQNDSSFHSEIVTEGLDVRLNNTIFEVGGLCNLWWRIEPLQLLVTV